MPCGGPPFPVRGVSAIADVPLQTSHKRLITASSFFIATSGLQPRETTASSGAVLGRRYKINPSPAPAFSLRVLGDFSKRKSLYHHDEAGEIRISHLGNSGWRASRASTACMARLLSVTPLW